MKDISKPRSVSRADPEWEIMWETLGKLHDLEFSQAKSEWMYMGDSGSSFCCCHTFKNRHIIPGETTYQHIPYSAEYFLAKVRASK